LFFKELQDSTANKIKWTINLNRNFSKEDLQMAKGIGKIAKNH
jgi:hypothetical protein